MSRTSPKRLESQVLETGKLTGVSRRFGDSMEQIPIKKRRFFFRSPTPPPQSPRNESGDLQKSTHLSDQPTVTVQKKSKSEFSNVETSTQDADFFSHGRKNLKDAVDICACDDEVSGIAILAACIDMLDEPSANTLTAFEESISKEQIKSPKDHIADVSLPQSFCITGQAMEQIKTSTASCDDRLHWDLNAPMDEWDRPVDDTIVDSTMKLETATVDCSLEKEQVNEYTGNEPSLQPSIIGVTDEAELDHNASDISQIQCIGPSSCLKDEIIPFGVSHAQVVDRYKIDPCLCLGSNDTKISISEGQSRLVVSDLHDVAIEGSESIIQVDKTEKSIMNMLLKPGSMETDFDTGNPTCEAMKNSKIFSLDESCKELLGISNKHNPMASEMQELALLTGTTSVNEASDKFFNNTSHCNVNEDPVGIFKFSEVNFNVSNLITQSLDASHLDAKNCEFESLQASDLQEEACNIHTSNCDDIQVPKKKSELDDTSCRLGDVAQCVEPYPVGSEKVINELNSASISCYSSKSEDVYASTSNDGKSVKHHCGVPMNDCGISVDHELQICMKVENTLTAKGDGKHVDLKKLSSGDSSDHVLQLQVSQEELSQAISTGLEGGFDLYLEDGELRKHHWVDNGSKIGESEHCDYDSNNRDEIINAASTPTAERVLKVLYEKPANQLHEDLHCDNELLTLEKKIEDVHCYRHRNSFLAGDDVVEDCLKVNPSTSKSIFTAQLSAMDNPEVVDMELDDGRKSIIVSNDPRGGENDGFKDIEDVYIEGSGLKDSRREAPSSSFRRGNHVNPSSRYNNYNQTYYRDERQIGADESVGSGRSLHIDYGGRIGNRCWNHGHRSNVLDRSTEGGDEKFAGPSDHEFLGAHQQGMFLGSRGGYTNQKRSLGGRSEECDMGRGKTRCATSESAQKNKYDMHHLMGLGRGHREGYRRPIYETPNSSHLFIKREQSFSPRGSGVVDTHPPKSSHKRSRSRSRTQSPDLRHDGRAGRKRAQHQNSDNFSERRGAPFRVFGQDHRFENDSGRLRTENCHRLGNRPVRFLDGPPSGRPHQYDNGNDCKRKPYPPRSYGRLSRSMSRSCSPELRNEVRMGRMRLPYSGHGHTKDNNMTDRRSTQTMFHSPPSRLRSGGGYMRPDRQLMRLHNNARPSSRGNEYEGDDFRRKPRTIFDRIRHTRNFDTEGDGRRFEYNAEDSGFATQSVRGDNYVRNGDRRLVDGAPRE